MMRRGLVNVNSELPDTNPVPQVRRPYEVAIVLVPTETISLAAFGDLLKETT